MIPRRSVSVRQILYLAVCFSAAGISARAQAQDTSTTPQTIAAPRLNQSGILEFQTALKNLSQKYSSPIVVEGFPLRKSILEEKAQKANASMPQSVVDCATVYDYNVAKIDNVFVFQKRYSQTDDVPLVSLDECRATLRDAIADLSRFTRVPTQLSNVGPMTSLYTNEEAIKETMFSSFLSLPDEQWRQIEQPYGLRLGQLQKAQQENVVVYALNSDFDDTLLSVLGTARHLDILALRKPIVCFRDGAKVFQNSSQLIGVSLFGYEYLSGPQHAPMFRPQSHPNYVVCDAVHVAALSFTNRSSTTKTANAKKDETAPDAQDYVWAQVDKSVPTVYLGEAINRLNEHRIENKEGNLLPYSIDPALAEKPVFVVGEDKVAPEAIFHGLASVYGLRVVKNEKGEERITRLRPTVPRNLQELPSAMRATLPLPLQKVLQSDQKTQKLALGSGLSFDRNSDIQFHIATVKHLRAATEPTIKAAKDGRVPLSELGPEASRDLAVALLTTDYLQTIRELQTHHFPDYLSDMNRVAVTGKRTVQADGSVIISLNICEVGPDGKLLPRFVLPNHLFLPDQKQPTIN